MQQTYNNTIKTNLKMDIEKKEREIIITPKAWLKIKVDNKPKNYLCNVIDLEP